MGKTTNFVHFCSGRHGFVVAITGIENIGKGLIRDGTGFVTFPVKYQCVVCRPFKGEILEAVVTMVNKVYLIYVSSLIKHVILGLYWCRYITICIISQMGFFAEAGPVQIFVSNHVSLYFVWLWYVLEDCKEFFFFFKILCDSTVVLRNSFCMFTLWGFAIVEIIQEN